jgi:predicted CopG family antitoxin
MSTATVRIPEKKRDVLKVIATLEKREMKEILSDLIDEYIARHQETMDLLSRPEWVKIIEQGKAEVVKGIKGKTLDELED